MQPFCKATRLSSFFAYDAFFLDEGSVYVDFADVIDNDGEFDAAFIG